MAKRKKRARGEGACFHSDSKGCWVARAIVGKKPDGSPLYQETTARTQAAALAKKKKLEDGAAMQVVGGEQAMTDYLTHYLDNVASGSLAPRTLMMYRMTTRLHLVPAIGTTRLGALSASHLETLFGGMLRAGYAGASVRKARTVLSAALTHAVRQGLIALSPLSRVQPTRLDDKEICPLSPDEVKAVLSAAPEVRHGLAAVLALGSGARRGELLALGWEHTDATGRSLRIERSLYQLEGGYHLKPPKTKSGRRTIALPEFAAAALRQARARAEAEGRMGSPIFHDPKTGSWLCCNRISKQWHALLRLAGVPYRRFHDARHTHASELLRLGVPITEVARRLGDRPETVLKVYAHYLPSPEGVPALLDALYRPVGGEKVEKTTRAGDRET